MKRYLILITLLYFNFTACLEDVQQHDNGIIEMSFSAPMIEPTDFISLDSGNKMLNSYLNSINYISNDTSVRSFLLNADQLRIYLTDTSIKGMKVMLAHNLSYINAGNANKNVGYNKSGLTILIAGFNRTGDYTLFGTDAKVLNKALPCPNNCPPGTALNPLLSR